MEPEDLLEQVAIEESLRDATPPDAAHGTAPAVNAQVSDALLRTRVVDTGPRVAILKYSRAPRAFKEVFAQSRVLARRRETLEANRFQSILEAGANVFVKPEHYIATMEAIGAKGLRLFSSHVVVEAELVDHVASLVGGIHQGVYPRGSETVPIGYPVPIGVERTFINIPVPSSLWSSTE